MRPLKTNNPEELVITDTVVLWEENWINMQRSYYSACSFAQFEADRLVKALQRDDISEGDHSMGISNHRL